MGYSLIDKLTNFLMPVDNNANIDYQEQAIVRSRKPLLQLHSQTELKVYVAVPRDNEEICRLADCLMNKVALLVNYSQINHQLQQNIHDFLSGVSYVTNSNYTRITERIYMYVPEYADFDKRLFATTIPTYVKRSKEVDPEQNKRHL